VSLLERLAASVDHPIPYKVVYNNGPTGALEDFRNSHPDWIVREPAIGNRGVAGSWNDCATKLFPDEPAWLLMNDDAWFSPGYLRDICNCWRAHKDAHIIFLNDSMAFYCFIWTKRALDECGTFDENLWPAYYEDRDYLLRLAMGSCINFGYALKDQPPLQHGKPRSGGTNYAAMIQGCGLLNRQYLKRKWGAMRDDFRTAEYPTPYRDHRLTFKEWVWYPEQRAKLHPIYEAFMENNPSIYD
jgi:hypothetical protein